MIRAQDKAPVRWHLLVSTCLPFETEAAVLEPLALRLAACKTDCMEEIMEVGEAVKCLSKEDMEHVDKAKKSNSATVLTKKELSIELKEHVSDLRRKAAAKAKAAAKGKAAKKAVPPAEPALPAPRRLPDNVHTVTHAEAKTFMPPDSLLWRSTSPAGWHSRVCRMPYTFNRYLSCHGDRALWIVPCTLR